jgi:hypothetical protein
MKDIYGIQKLSISLFRWEVPKFNKGNSNLFRLGSRGQKNTRPYRLTSAIYFSNLDLSKGTVLNVRVGWLLQKIIFYNFCGTRIDCSHRSFHLYENKDQQKDNRGIETTDDLINKIQSKRNEKTGKYENLFPLIVSEANL